MHIVTVDGYQWKSCVSSVESVDQSFTKGPPYNYLWKWYVYYHSTPLMLSCLIILWLCSLMLLVSTVVDFMLLFKWLYISLFIDHVYKICYYVITSFILLIFSLCWTISSVIWFLLKVKEGGRLLCFIFIWLISSHALAGPRMI